ncbi:autotransporter outer membrane beta-barrel domain-containing protein [Fusobacterium ulcerans]|uniref:autotransporter outer membrane beta-barrel domain-containing protein n=1 Tax=Fusobacterium ulcerans TaxID=861 RepID=UPI002E788DA7|nr:autotransporter outer membrane beta-barrel domain-containing protein [Fusobacterium ulcerans]MEE0138044.1 autotransporter outer membrane beta-barrel domain-containing protein [Fusobacterium ulcerans]
MNKLENSFKKIFKRKINYTTSILISFLISGNISFATGQLEENIYNTDVEFMAPSGGNVIQTNNEETYTFNGNVLMKNGSNQPTIWALEGSNLTFNIANGKTLSVENIIKNGYAYAFAIGVNSNYSSNGIMNIYGGNLYIDLKRSEFDDAAYAFQSDNNGELNIDNQSIIIKNVDMGIKMQDDSKVDIKTGYFSIENSYYGIAMQQNSQATPSIDNIVKINSETNIDISSKMERNAASIYLLSYHKNNVFNKVHLTAKGNINLEASKYGIYSYGQNNVQLTGKNISISGNNYGIYSNGSSDYNDSKIDLNAQNSITITSNNGWAIASMKENSVVTFNGNISNISGASTLWASEKGKVNINTLENHIVSNGIAAKVTTEGEVNINKNNTAYSNTIEGGLWAETAGIINVNLNGEASYLTGYTWLGDGYNGFVNLGLSNNALWNNTEDSAVSNFKLNGGIVDMSYEKDHQLIEIGNLSGNNGTFIMDISGDDINQENSKTDFLEIKSADQSQKHYIKIADNSLEDLLNYEFTGPDKAIWIVDSDSNVLFKGEQLSDMSNLFNYTPILDTDVRVNDSSQNFGNDWYITGLKKKENEVTETIEDDMTLYYMDAAMARIEMDTLHKRLGDIRNYKEEVGTWARVLSGQIEYDKSGYLKNNYTMVQAGYDKSKASENGIWFTGFGIHHRKGKTDFRNGDGENRSLGLSLYKSWTGYNGQYFDIIGKYSHIDNEYKSFNKINEKMEADYNTWSGSLSIEYGKKKWSDNKKWYIQPNTQLNYTYVNGQNYKTSSGVRAEPKNINSLIGKAGIYAGHEFEKSNHFIKVAILHEFMGDYGVDIKGKDAELRKRADGKDSWFEIGIGGDFKVGKTDSMNVYYEIERTYGSDFETNWQASIGIRYRFNKLSDLLPASSPKPVENPVIKYTMTGKNHFTFDNSNLTEDGKKVIRIISEEINKNNKKGKLTIEGHTDSIGTTEYNQKLSEKRAESVEKEFKENLTTEINYQTKGYGKNKPTADNATPEGRAKNRRVDIKFE